jgi:hypothetical protein
MSSFTAPSSFPFLLRVGLLSAVAAVVPMGALGPPVARADALPGNPDDIYFHCTPPEQCPQGSEMCTALHKGAGRREVEPDCAAAARAKGLEQRCSGKSGYLFCPRGATGSYTPKPDDTNVVPEPPARRRGCRR